MEGRSVLGMLNDFLTWWAEQMLGLLPARVARSGGGGRSNAMVVAWRPGHPPHLDIGIRRDGQQLPAGSFALDPPGIAAACHVLAQRGRPPAIVLRGTADQLLERQLTLPLAAERDLGRVLRYEMDRLTPFDADEVFWSCAVERRDRARGTLHLRLSLVAKASVQAATDALRALGTVPAWLEVPVSGGAVRQIDLGAPQADRGRSYRATRVAAGVCGALALAAVCLPFVLQYWQFHAVEARIDAMQPRMAEIDALRRRSANQGTGSNVMSAERARIGDALQVLATITELLPDDTMLTDFSLSQGKLGLGGVSSAASRLIPTLAGDPLIRNPTFVAPVTRAGDGRGEGRRGEAARVDRFAIRAELAPG